MHVTVPTGVLIDEPLVRVLDIPAMEWEEEVDDRGEPLGTARKVIATDANGEPAVCARWYLPQAFTPGARIRHDERSFAYCLGGEVELWECDPDERVVVREGTWIDRRPGSEYRFGDNPTPTGVMLLEWRMGGDDPLLPIGAADTMTHGVPYNDRSISTYPKASPGTPRNAPPAPGSVVVDRPGVTILNTRLMEWDPHPSIGNSYLKVLSRNADGEPILVLWYLPPGVAGSELPHRGVHDYRECAYILEGELRHWEYDDVSDDEGALITFREGLFLDRMANSLHGVEDEISSKTGCTILFMRSLHMPFIGDREWRERHTVVG